MPEQPPEDLDPDRQGASAYQHAWMDLLDDIRGGLREKLKEVPCMSPEGVMQFSLACHNFFRLEHHARLADKHLQDGRDKIGSYES